MHPNNIKIGGRLIGANQKPFIIAEMSGNHNQSLDRALAIVDAAAKCGVDALKLQTYTADTMTLNLSQGEFLISDKDSLWNNKTLFKLYQEAYTPWEWHKPIIERCREHGLMAFSTPFDITAVEFLNSLDVPCFKVASFENTDIRLIKKIASYGKPMIISTGMATVADLDETVREAKSAGCPDIILLKCTSSYPASPENTNLRTIPHLRDLFGVQVGLSDHTLGIGAAVASIALGSTVIEKHFTICRADGGVDSAFSLEPAEMKMLVDETNRAWQALGEIHYGISESEKRSLQFRRSLYVSADIKEGEPFTENNVREIRPGHGLPCKYIDIILGKRVSRNISKGTPVSWDMLE
jgi:pseudaminic acid synthase